MGVDMNPVTSGPKVNESLETNIPGVFACGNVLHVHDLVDFVSEEAKTAGKNAAAYVKADGVKAARDNDIVLNPIEGVRYTVPGTINVANMDEQITVRFRVGGVYKNCYVSAYFDDERVIHRKTSGCGTGGDGRDQADKRTAFAVPGFKDDHSENRAGIKCLRANLRCK